MASPRLPASSTRQHPPPDRRSREALAPPRSGPRPSRSPADGAPAAWSGTLVSLMRPKRPTAPAGRRARWRRAGARAGIPAYLTPVRRTSDDRQARRGRHGRFSRNPCGRWSGPPGKPCSAASRCGSCRPRRCPRWSCSSSSQSATPPSASSASTVTGPWRLRRPGPPRWPPAC